MHQPFRQDYLFNDRYPLDIRIYSDEIKVGFTNALGERWMYIGFVVIPLPRYEHAWSIIQSSRQESCYESEVHFKGLKNYSFAHVHNKKALLARRWVEAVLNDEHKAFHFHLLGINTTNIQEQAFGDTGAVQRLNIYNRFYRSSLVYLIKSFFPGREVRVAMIYHDNERSLQQHDRFDWHSIKAIGRNEDRISFLRQSIEFVDSDHTVERNYPQASHFVQLCDVLTGGISHVLDARSNKDGCNEIAALLHPLVKWLTLPKQLHGSDNPFAHKNRLSVSFFPERRLKLVELDDPNARRASGFYHTRPILYQGQKSD